MSVQVILKEGKPEYAVIPYELYERLVADAEMIEDIRNYDPVRPDLDQRNGEPAGLINELSLTLVPRPS
jgi:hypothetical protein